MDNDLGVALGAEPVAAGDEAITKGFVVVDFTVEHDLHGAVLVRHGLAGVRGQVDDLQPAETEPGRSPQRDVLAEAVRAAVRQPIAHRRERVLAHGAAVESQFTANAAHGPGVSLPWSPSLGAMSGAMPPV